ncbi:MAG: hypothetical protein K1X74_12710 [Pirellulales bacterium]|nr:hypothetical protein [Pirellulales bacterium]
MLVVERRACWAPAIRQATVGQIDRVVECRSLDEAGARLADWPDCIVGVEVSCFAAAGSVARLERLRRRFPRAAWIALGTSEWQTALELGVSAAWSQLHELSGIESLAARHFALQPRRRWGVREAIWQRLPWSPATNEPVSRSRTRRQSPQPPETDAAIDFEPTPDFEPLDEA